MIDIGGGSVEFIVGDEKRAALLESRKLGAARMTARFVKSDPINEEDHRQLVKHYDKELAPLMKQIEALHPVKVIGTSGTLENLAAMCGSEPHQNGDKNNHPQVIERDAIRKASGRTAGKPLQRPRANPRIGRSTEGPDHRRARCWSANCFAGCG